MKRKVRGAVRRECVCDWEQNGRPRWAIRRCGGACGDEKMDAVIPLVDEKRAQ